METVQHRSSIDNVYDFTKSADFVPLPLGNVPVEEQCHMAINARPNTAIELSREGFDYCLESTSPIHVTGNLFCHWPKKEPALLYWREQQQFFAKRLSADQMKRLTAFLA